jgi:hypothetical protein
LHDLWPPHELPALHDVPLARRIDEHGLGRLDASHDADQLELVERIVIEHDLALRANLAAHLLDEQGGAGAERIAAAITLRELGFLKIDRGYSSVRGHGRGNAGVWRRRGLRVRRADFVLASGREDREQAEQQAPTSGHA